MKNWKILFACAMVAVFVTTWTACNNDDDEMMEVVTEATCNDGVQNGDETGIDCGGTCDACPTCDDGVQNGDETGVDCGGSCDACPTCDDGIQNGDETGVDCGGSCDECTEGVQGKNWQSSGDNVAILLATFLNVDSIYVEFGVDFTYRVEQYDTDGVMTELTGTYTQSPSSQEGIFDINLIQSAPFASTVEGIYEIDATGTTLTYEVVQTDPAAGTPPTAMDGFGSTNGGTLVPPTANVQTYLLVE